MNAILPDDVKALIDTMHSGIREILGDKLVGLYVFGSLTTGAFEEPISDIDLLAALTVDLADEEFARLEQFHLDLMRANPQWDNRLEVGYIPLGSLRRIKPESGMARISPGEPFHRTEAGNNWPFNLAQLRSQGLTITGPPPETLIDPISAADLVTVLKALMKEWRTWVTETDLIHHRTYQGYMVITMCRGLYLFHTGEVASKRQATAWAIDTYPAWSSLIRDALRWRAGDDGQPDPVIALRLALEFVAFTIRTILEESSL